MHRLLKKYFSIFVLPTFVCYLLVFIIPFALGIGLSFTRFTTVENASFVGLENYRRIFEEGDGFLRSVGFGLLYSLVCVIIVNVCALLLSVLLVRPIRGVTVFRSIFFLPNLIGGIVLGYVWNLLINGILQGRGVDITYRASYGFWGLVALGSWQLIGYMTVIYIAALVSVPREVLEASAMDGAGPIATFFKVKLPMILPSVGICTFLTLTNTFKTFDQNLALTGGAPEGQTALPALDIFKTFYGRVGSQGVGQAKAVIFFLIVALLAFAQQKLIRRRDDS